jgi:hypothetical protein
LRRVEFSHPEVNRNLRTLMLRTGKHYDAGSCSGWICLGARTFGHHRYLLDAVD